jgi:flavin-dependent dehydrogenase
MGSNAIEREAGAARGHAVVIGGSMAGLLAARVVSEYFDRVTVIDRDNLPINGSQRRGVPQGWHAHALLAGGLAVTEDLFPGITDALTKDGALIADPAKDGRWFFEGGFLKKLDSGLKALLVSRPFLESRVRSRLLGSDNIVIKSVSSARGLVCKNGRVQGVILDDRKIEADLVIDASGRGSQAPNWLESIGFERPAEEKVEIQLAYTTQVFVGGVANTSELFTVVPSTPSGKRGGVILAPDGFLVFGDAVSSLNPIYGQGMSSAALQAAALRDALSEVEEGLARRFFKAAGKVVDNPWGVAVGGDLKMPEVPGRRPRSVSFINWYLTKLHKAAHLDPAATNAFIRVAQLIDSPPAIFAPRVVAKVARHGLFAT